MGVVWWGLVFRALRLGASCVRGVRIVGWLAGWLVGWLIGWLVVSSCACVCPYECECECESSLAIGGCVDLVVWWVSSLLGRVVVYSSRLVQRMLRVQDVAYIFIS